MTNVFVSRIFGIKKVVLVCPGEGKETKGWYYETKLDIQSDKEYSIKSVIVENDLKEWPKKDLCKI